LFLSEGEKIEEFDIFRGNFPNPEIAEILSQMPITNIFHTF